MNAPVLTPGGRIDEKQPVKPVRIAVLTISDTRDEESDTSGHVLAERVKAAGHELVDKAICKDSVVEIREKIEGWVASGYVEAIITTGGTGITGRDVTPEAVEPLFDKKLDGFSIIFHLVSYQSVGLSTLQSRATAGIVKGVFVFCLPLTASSRPRRGRPPARLRRFRRPCRSAGCPDLRPVPAFPSWP